MTKNRLFNATLLNLVPTLIGLGLSLAYDIVTKGHGGTLEVESKENEASIFMLKLPF